MCVRLGHAYAVLAFDFGGGVERQGGTVTTTPVKMANTANEKATAHGQGTIRLFSQFCGSWAGLILLEQPIATSHIMAARTVSIIGRRVTWQHVYSF